MSTVTATFSPYTYHRHVVEEVTENAVYSAFYNLLSERKKNGLTKADVADRMETDRASVTKLTTAPTNMKIKTIACLANAMDADVVFVLVDRRNRSQIFTSFGTFQFRHSTRMSTRQK